MKNHHCDGFFYFLQFLILLTLSPQSTTKLMENNNLRKEALNYHSQKPRGKVEVIPSKPHSTQRDLALAYSPGVAEPCKEIEKNVANVYKYTNKGNLVAVISNGTAVLGLGDIGAEASKPVMEGKGLLFKIFAGINVFDIEINEKDPDKFVEIVKSLEPTFGGINLEDIKAPEAFIIEKRLKEELTIPVMHDDQHGTAIISGAALINALEVIGKKLNKVKIVVNGAGAAAIACTKLYIKLGANPDNILMCDSKGVINHKRENLTEEKKQFIQKTEHNTLAEAMQNADVFIGLSQGNVVTTEMLLAMNTNPIVFAMANPTPEIDYKLAISTRNDVIMATGRSDYPNQVNNVLGFPYIFRGALDVQATAINEEMKLAAVYAIAQLAKEVVPEMVLLAYHLNSLSFGREYLIPKPFDSRLLTKVSAAVAKAAMDSGVAKAPITDWTKYEEELQDYLGKDNKLIRMMQNRARSLPKTIVLSNAEEINILKAAQILQEEKIAKPILLGNRKKIKALISQYELDDNFTIEDPQEEINAEKTELFSQLLWKQRQRKGITTIHQARRLMTSRDYYGPMMVKTGEADALITGYSKRYAAALKPVLECIDKAEGVSKVSAMTMVIVNGKPIFFADTSIIQNPTWEDLVKIAKISHWVVKQLGIEPRIAMLSFENFSGTGESSKKMITAVNYLHKYYPNMIVDGEMQADFALREDMLTEFPFTKFKGKAANVLIFPNLESANISYKIVRGIKAGQTIGPIILGLEKPIHILQMRASVEEIVNLATMAILDAQERKSQNR